MTEPNARLRCAAPFMARIGVVLVFVLASCTSTGKKNAPSPSSSTGETPTTVAGDTRTLPPVEPWGRLSHPFGDAIDQAAREALGVREPRYSVRYDEIWLEDFYALDGNVRQFREAVARELRERARTLKRVGGVDSLGLYLEALHTAPVDVPSYEEASRILLDRGAWRRAHALLVQGIRLDPHNGVLWTLLGSAYAQIGANERARLALEFALQQGDRAVERTNVAEMLATLYVQLEEYARAESLVAARSGQAPEWLGRYASAKQALQRGDYTTARVELLQATTHRQAQSAVYVDLGSVEQQLGNLDAAEEAYREALRLHPHLQSARTGLGVVQWAQGDFDAAMLRFSRLVRTNPYNYAAQFNYGGTLLDAARAHEENEAHVADSLYALAVSRFSVCIEADYRTPYAYTGRAQAYLGTGNFDAARADAEQLALQPQYEETARLLLARVALTSGDPAAVVAALEPSYEAGSLSHVGLAMLGKAFLELKRHERAADVLLRAVESGDASLSASMNYAVALSESGRLDEAEMVLRGLIEEHPDNAELLQNLAAVLQRQGRISEADRLLIQINRLEGR